MRKMNEVSERVIMDEVKWLFGDEMIMKLMFQTQHVEKKKNSVALCVQLKELELRVVHVGYRATSSYLH